MWALAFAALIATTGCTSQPPSEETEPGGTLTVPPTAPQPTAVRTRPVGHPETRTSTPVQTRPVGQPETPTPLPVRFEGAAIPAEAAEVVAMAVADLAQRQEVEEDAIRVASVKAVQRRDASLGCPRKGMMYAQVITPGFRVVLEAGGEAYAYHTSLRHAVLCTTDTP
jgi:hypothetical protein